jgi:hypothetical protein
MDQGNFSFLAGYREHSGALGVATKGGLTVHLCSINIRISGGINDQRRPRHLNRTLHCYRIIYVGTRPAGEMELRIFRGGAVGQLATELPSRA